MTSHSRWVIGALAIGAVITVALMAGNRVAIALESDRTSVSFGRKGSGALAYGKRLPSSGHNFIAYSRLGTFLGRNTVHSAVRATVVDAYKELERTQPSVAFVYGETGWSTGGPFRPHRSHQNGLSVDFMVPVRDARGSPTVIPTAFWRKFGYALEFDSTGRAGALRIDYEAIAAHLTALEHAAARHGLAIELVIFAPELMRELARAKQGGDVVRRLPFMTGRPWIRHDEHYHVDFRPLTRGLPADVQLTPNGVSAESAAPPAPTARP